MTTYNGLTEVHRAIAAIIAPMSLAQVQAACADRTSAVFYLSRLMRRYDSAMRYADRYTDLIGVGAISFAQARMVEFQRRVKCRAPSGLPLGF